MLLLTIRAAFNEFLKQKPFYKFSEVEALFSGMKTVFVTAFFAACLGLTAFIYDKDSETLNGALAELHQPIIWEVVTLIFFLLLGITLLFDCSKRLKRLTLPILSMAGKACFNLTGLVTGMCLGLSIPSIWFSFNYFLLGIYLFVCFAFIQAYIYGLLIFCNDDSSFGNGTLSAEYMTCRQLIGSIILVYMVFLGFDSSFQ